MNAQSGCVTTVFSCFLLLCLSHDANAWKPIAAPSPAGGVSASFTTSFTLQQAHPPEKAHYAFANADDDSKSSGETKLAEDLQLQGVINGQQQLALTGGRHHYGDDYITNSYASAGVPTDGRPYMGRDTCAMKKYAFNADGVVKYDIALPEFTQFTICFWMRFTNHSGDHVPLTYAVEKEPREIQFWIANSKNSSFISMAIKGQQMYRLNYPLRTRQWHHICSSWNGKTGEWQVWLKAERIGRGFHNSLVGYKIPASGKLYSGGPSVTGDIAHGLHFEVTVVQIYRIALSAGKAHRDHKHHHAHHFDHEGMELATTTKPPPVINRPQTMSNLLANGQIPTRVRLNLAQPNTPLDGVSQTQLLQVQPQQTAPPAQPAITIHTNFVNGQINGGSRLVAQQLLGHALPLRQQTTQTTQIHKYAKNPANVQYVDESETRIFFKRQADAKNATASTMRRRAAREADRPRKQRGLVLLKDGSIVDDGIGDTLLGDYKFDGLTDFAAQQFKDDLYKQYEERSNESAAASAGGSNIDDQVAEHDREPAEEEVKAVMALCGACETEPFQGAIVFAWKSVQAELDNALQGYTVGSCGDF